MGYLLGAFGKLASGSRYRSIQARLMRVQAQMRRVSRQVADAERQINYEEKQQLNAIKTMTYNMETAKMLVHLAGDAASGFKKMRGEADGEMTDNEREALRKQFGSKELNGVLEQVSSAVQQAGAMQTQMVQQQAEMKREMILQPLKDLEDELATEKDSLESQMQIAKADYEACQKMEQADAKMLAPNYTAG